MGRLLWFSQTVCLCFMLLHFRVQCSSPSQSALNISPPHLCRPKERSALLDFKRTTLWDFCRDSWNKSIDCCLWEGITCDKRKGHVIGLDLSWNCIVANLTTNSSLFRLEKLQSLNLAGNYFDYPSISFGFHRWKSLTYLNLSGSFQYINDSLIFEISLLQKLVSLDLSGNNGLLLDNMKFQFLVHNLTELRILILDFVDLSLVVPSSLLNLTSSLEHLSLSDCILQGDFPSQVFHLRSLQFLDLAYNYKLRGNLPKSNWSSPLKYLNLTKTKFSGELPHSIGNLRLLKEMDLYECQFYGSVPTSFANLTELTFLDFSRNNLQGQIPEVFEKMHKLTYLSFSENNSSGEIPASIFNLTVVTFLSLSSNKLIGHLPHNISGLTFLPELSLTNNLITGRVPSWLFSLPSLFHLDLSQNRLTGPIDHIQNPSLILNYVDLSNNEISGSIPSSFFDLVNLTSVDLSSNNLNGTITPHMLSKLVNFWDLNVSNNSLLSLDNNDAGVNYSSLHLESVDFSSCNIRKFPSFLRKAQGLGSLDISKNKISGQIHKWEIEGMSAGGLNLSYNFLTSIDLSASTNLVNVDLSFNSLQGSLPFLSIPNNLEWLIMSGNNMTGEIPSSYCNLIHLTYLQLPNNSLGGKIPECLGNLSDLYLLDLQFNKFHGRIPSSFCNFSSLGVLDLAENSLEGEIPEFLSMLNELSVIDLRMNKFLGRIPNSFVNNTMLRTLNLNGNQLEGEIHSSFCNFSSLGVLDLAENSLEGEIPECLSMLNELSVIDLRMNKFLGRIPNSFVNNNMLRTLDLNGNQLVGRLPRSLVNCSLLEVLDVGNNYLNDTFPHWLGVLQRLQVLILQSNRLHGSISNSMTALPSFSQLRIIDISHNQFDGLLPAKYFQNFKGMRNVYQDESDSRYIGEDYYKDSVKVVMKGREVELVRILKIFTTIDLSSNRFHGPIPKELGALNSLVLLNLSHNSLTGEIPSSLDKMVQLESLDLSSNMLEGKIPKQLTCLTFLSVLNLSHNKLEGHIPEGKQFNTFSNDSYFGNSGLCGFPLTKKCHNDEEPEAPPSNVDEEEDGSAALFNWKFALAGYGCGLVLGLSLGYIVFTIGKPWRLVKKVEQYQQKFVTRCNHKYRKRKTQKPNQRT